MSNMNDELPINEAFDKLQQKNIELEEKIENFNVLLRKEASRNAYISCTGKSVNDIQIDGINEMIFKLSDGKSPISLDEINEYIQDKEVKGI